jgi:hypothetical protein
MLIKNKRGASYFIFDAVIAAIIFFMAMSSLLSRVDYSPELEIPRSYGENLINYYMNTEIRDVDLPQENDVVDVLIENNNITNVENTILEQMLIFYHDNKDEVLEDFVVNISKGKIPDSFGLNVSIENDQIYFRENSADSFKSFVKVRRLIFAKLDDGTLYGPKIIQVSVWY